MGRGEGKKGEKKRAEWKDEKKTHKEGWVSGEDNQDLKIIDTDKDTRKF